jgi:hypothetical protein
MLYKLNRKYNANSCKNIDNLIKFIFLSKIPYFWYREMFIDLSKSIYISLPASQKL